MVQWQFNQVARGGKLISLQRTSRLRNNFATHYFVMGFNCAITFIACSKRFELLEYASQGFEWVNALSPKPSFDVCWEIELMAMP